MAENTTLTVRSIAGTLVLPGTGRSLMEIHVYVASGATLVFSPSRRSWRRAATTP